MRHVWFTASGPLWHAQRVQITFLGYLEDRIPTTDGRAMPDRGLQKNICCKAHYSMQGQGVRTRPPPQYCATGSVSTDKQARTNTASCVDPFNRRFQTVAHLMHQAPRIQSLERQLLNRHRLVQGPACKDRRTLQPAATLALPSIHSANALHRLSSQHTGWPPHPIHNMSY
jgi:hypothetical protein